MKIQLKRILILLPLIILWQACSYVPVLKPSAKVKEKTTVSAKQTAPEIEGMAFIPGGTFMMGSRYKKDEAPIHSVTVSGFYLDKTEVTVEAYRRFCQATRRHMPEQPEWSEDDHPVVNIDWKHARAYSKWVGKRLPSEAEWEYAARSTLPGVEYARNLNNRYGLSFGNIADESILQIKLRFPIKPQYDDGYIHSAPVASFPMNIFDVFDLEGNVLEWCADWYDATYYRTSPKLNPKGPAKGSYKVIRGASWNRSGSYLRATYRSWYPLNCAFNFLGFRCAKNL